MKKAFKYSLERGSKKHKCPACHKKTFVRYIDEEGSCLSDSFGRCDREQKCGYFNKPESNENIVSTEVPNIPEPEPSYLSLEYLDRYFGFKNESKNNFIQFLNKTMNNDRIDAVITDYFISTYEYWGSWATIFWQIDEKERIRSGQVILYDSETGKRIKKPFSHITWMHSILEKKGEIKDFNLKQCLFGLHLINEYPDKSIAIVEAPKTACIMASIYPKFLWMATCGLSNIKPEKLKPIKDKKIILYPDVGAFDAWSEKAETLKKFGYEVEVSELLESRSKPSHKGLDIADFFI